MTNFQSAIAAAKQELKKTNPDGHFAIFMVRDFEELKELDLDKLAWSFYHEGWVPANDARWFFELIEKQQRKIKGEKV